MKKPNRKGLAFALALMFVFSTALTACTDGDEKTTDPAQSETAAGDTTAATEPATEPDTDAPENLTAEDAQIKHFTVSQTYQEKHTVQAGNVSFTTGDISVNLKYDSLFYGSESAVDHDSMHLGDIFRSAVINHQVPENYRCGDLDGDRRDELFVFADGVLTGYQFSDYSTKALSTVMTQKYNFDGWLVGIGDFNGDRYNDAAFYTKGGHVVIAYGSETGFAPKDCGKLPETVDGSKLYVADVNGDTVADILLIDGLSLTSYTQKEDGTFAQLAKTEIADGGDYIYAAVSDINTDHISDVCLARKNEAGVFTLTTYFGRGDGSFGPKNQDEVGNLNLYPTYICDKNLEILYITGGDYNKDGVGDYIATIHDTKKDTTYLYSFIYPVEAPAYDYSSHVIQLEDGSYILYTGTLYSDFNNNPNKTEGDHPVAYTSKDGVIWHRNLDAPCLYTGYEDGVSGEWYSGNTMEPEVVYVNGVFYMYFQTECYTYSEFGEYMGNDHIGVATSTDGIHFTRNTTPVISTNDPYYSFDHQEVIYVPDDPDGCFWMYVWFSHNNVRRGCILLKSDDPTSFHLDTNYGEPGYTSATIQLKNAQYVSNFNNLGNQTGYINDVSGGRLFVRISFKDVYDEGNAHKMPSLQFSRDGIKWTELVDGLTLASTDVTDPNNAQRKDVYFLGMSTLNGTGEIRPNADGSYTIVYVGCTSNSAAAPAIFYSSEGCGSVTFTLDVSKIG